MKFFLSILGMLLAVGAVFGGRTPLSLPKPDTGEGVAALEAIVGRGAPVSLKGTTGPEVTRELLQYEDRLRRLIRPGSGDPVSIGASGFLARSLGDRGELDAAAEVCRKMLAALAIPRDIFDANRLLAEVYAGAGRADLAVESLGAYLATKPPEEFRDRAEAGLIHFLEAAGRYDAAADLTLQQILGSAPAEHRLDLLMNAAADRAQGRDPKKAIAEIDRLSAEARQRGRWADAEMILGSAEAALGHFDQASRHFRTAAKDLVGLARNAATIAESEMWQRSGKLERAIRLLSECSDSQDSPIECRRLGLELIGKPAPELAGLTTDGEPFKLADLKGRHVLLFFWATYSNDSYPQLPVLRTIARDLEGKPFSIVAVSLDFKNDQQLLRGSLARHGIPWKTIFLGGDFAMPEAIRWGVRMLPQTFLISPDGRVLAAGLRGRDLREAAKQAVVGELPRN